MGRVLFGVDIAAEVAEAFADELTKVTLRSVPTTTRSTTNPSAGTQGTPTEHVADAVVIGIESLVEGTIRPETRDAILLIGDSITPRVEPKNNDTITIEGEETTIVSVSTDPAKATFTCQVK